MQPAILFLSLFVIVSCQGARPEIWPPLPGYQPDNNKWGQDYGEYPYPENDALPDDDTDTHDLDCEEAKRIAETWGIDINCDAPAEILEAEGSEVDSENLAINAMILAKKKSENCASVTIPARVVVEFCGCYDSNCPICPCRPPPRDTDA